MTESLVLYELQKIRDASNKAKDELKFNFRMARSLDKLYFNASLLNTTKLSLEKLSVYQSVFIITVEKILYIYIGVECVQFM